MIKDKERNKSVANEKGESLNNQNTNTESSEHRIRKRSTFTKHIVSTTSTAKILQSCAPNPVVALESKNTFKNKIHDCQTVVACDSNSQSQEGQVKKDI